MTKIRMIRLIDDLISSQEYEFPVRQKARRKVIRAINYIFKAYEQEQERVKAQAAELRCDSIHGRSGGLS